MPYKFTYKLCLIGDFEKEVLDFGPGLKTFIYDCYNHAFCWKDNPINNIIWYLKKTQFQLPSVDKLLYGSNAFILKQPAFKDFPEKNRVNLFNYIEKTKEDEKVLIHEFNNDNSILGVVEDLDKNLTRLCLRI